jgi:hypothetical protein
MIELRSAPASQLQIKAGFTLLAPAIGRRFALRRTTHRTSFRPDRGRV